MPVQDPAPILVRGPPLTFARTGAVELTLKALIDRAGLGLLQAVGILMGRFLGFVLTVAGSCGIVDAIKRSKCRQ